MENRHVRVRFAPSPTGRMHVGNLRTALYAYLIAKHEGGTFMLRIEDTDQERQVEGAVDIINRTLEHTGLIADEGPDNPGDVGPYVQSERVKAGIYSKYAKMLIDKGEAYRCFCGKERLESLKQNIDGKEIVVYDKHCLHLSEEDEEKIIELSQDPHIYDKIIKSTAPSIRGYREVKEAIALQLFGGAAKQLEDETKLRGDIHILIVGDPGIGKSQILKYVSRLAPRSIYTSGKGTSGAGLTAAAVRDELGGWSLEAGALVLGDQGNVCVDELDKMRSEDRSALHEALEQQTVSIAKAGIMATLNSRCSVLAAANPKFGRFDRFKVLAEQIDLPAPIISRFDLIFVIEDKPSREKDSDLAKHILEIHKENTVNYEIEPELLRKYIAYARKNINPRLTDEANEILREFYVNTRNSNPEEQGAVPITARQLEATIRLAEASAKIKLKDKVEAEDANKAVKLTMFCLKDIGVDPETGEIDIDRIGDGTPKSDRDKIQRVTEEIALLEEEFAGDAPLNVLLSNMNEKYGVSEEKTEQIVRNLKQKGVIYEPNAGYFRRVI